MSKFFLFSRQFLACNLMLITIIEYYATQNNFAIFMISYSIIPLRFFKNFPISISGNRT